MSNYEQLGSNAVNPEGKALSRIATEGLNDSERIHPRLSLPQSQQIDSSQYSVPFRMSSNRDILSMYQE